MVVTGAETSLIAALTPLVLPLGGGAITGFLIAKAVKLALKISMIVVGGILALLAYLSANGFITANFPKIEQAITEAAQSAAAQLQVMIGTVATQFHQSGTITMGAGGTGFVMGFVMGIRK